MSRRRHRSPKRRAPYWGLIGVGLGLALLMGCSSFSTEEKPLPDSTFTRILTELHLSRARQAREMPVPPGLRDSVFARYDVHPSTVDSTLRYYSRHPQAFETLYQGVLDTLKSLQRPKEGPTLPDSLKDRRAGRNERRPSGQ